MLALVVLGVLLIVATRRPRRKRKRRIEWIAM